MEISQNKLTLYASKTLKRMKQRLFISLIIIASAILTLNPTEVSAKPRKEKVKNIVLMIGDGMGVAHITHLMIENKYQPINMQRATGGGMITTYSANNRVTDSAASATTYATGYKTNNAMLSVTPDGEPKTTILEKAEKAGYATGVVATSSITHATPAAFYAHSKRRYDSDTIAVQLLNSGIDVAFGGGDRPFTKRKDGRNLFDEARKAGYNVVQNIDSLQDVHSGNNFVIYPTGNNHLISMKQGRGDYLPKATAKALEILANNSRKGFFVMVEGSQIDYGGHGNSESTVLTETRDFDNAVGVAMDFADRNPGTLIIILADHETGGMSIVSNNEDFTESESGVDARFSTGGHSGEMVPLLTYGAGAQSIGGIYDNVEIYTIMCDLLGLE